MGRPSRGRCRDDERQLPGSQTATSGPRDVRLEEELAQEEEAVRMAVKSRVRRSLY